MSPARRADPELDQLIEEITVDCHDEDEQLMGFEAAFDEDASLPCPGTVVCEDVQVLYVGRSDSRQILTVTCQRNGKRYEIALSTSTSMPTPPPHVCSPPINAGPVSETARCGSDWTPEDVTGIVGNPV